MAPSGIVPGAGIEDVATNVGAEAVDVTAVFALFEPTFAEEDDEDGALILMTPFLSLEEGFFPPI
jgi:hypothetical protein